MNMMQSRPHDFVLQLGDFVSRGTIKNYTEFIEKLEEVADRPFFPIIGNHDRASTNPNKPSDSTLYRETFGDDSALEWTHDFHFDHGAQVGVEHRGEPIKLGLV